MDEWMMKGITLTYKAAVTGVGNYLSAQVEENINHYQMKMLENNEIPGLLPVRGSMFNGVCRLNYEIEGMRRLSAVLAGGQLRGEEAKRFMGGLLHALSGLGEYFLSYMQCLLETDYIYVDEHGQARLVYVPLSERTIADEETVRVFCQKLFAEYFTSDGDPFFLNLLRYVNMQDFSFAGLLKQFEHNDGSLSGDVPAGKAGYAAGASRDVTAQAEAVSEKAFQRMTANAADPQGGMVPQYGTARKEGAAGKNSAAGSSGAESAPQKNMDAGFAIPGNPSFAVPQSGGTKKNETNKETNKESKEKKEKGSSLFKALLGKKEKSAEEKAKRNAGRDDKNTLPQVPQNAGGMGNAAGNGNNQSVAGSESGGWHGTVMLGTNIAENGSCTVMIGAGDAPYLLYQGVRVSMEHFPFSIGRDNADFIISKGTVSRPHITVSSRNGSYYVMDENSKNHTYLNGKQLAPYTEAELKDGDELRLANENMTFHI